MLYRNFAGDVNTITGAQSFASEQFANFVCVSARNTEAVRCGTRVATDVTICYPEGCLVQQREATYELWNGDSGGAVYNGGSTAIGIQSSCIDRTGDGLCTFGNTADNALYSHIQNVFVELGGSMSIYTGN